MSPDLREKLRLDRPRDRQRPRGKPRRSGPR
jgi:hypothetical protein